jgi:hypothetical protein
VTVVSSEGTQVITLHAALSLAERTMAPNPAGAAQVQDVRHSACLIARHPPLRRVFLGGKTGFSNERIPMDLITC